MGLHHISTMEQQPVCSGWECCFRGHRAAGSITAATSYNRATATLAQGEAPAMRSIPGTLNRACLFCKVHRLAPPQAVLACTILEGSRVAMHPATADSNQQIGQRIRHCAWHCTKHIPSQKDLLRTTPPPQRGQLPSASTNRA